MDILQVNNVTKQYANHVALDNVSLSVKENSIFGLLGPNGAGKTTLIRIINAITAPDSGTVLLNGTPMSLDRTAMIGYLPEERGLYKKMKVGEQALYLCRLKGLSRNDALVRLKYWFEKFEIESWWDKKVEELSKGMAQKVQFITTVLHEPKLLIFDEPFSGFDPVNAELLKNEILELRDKGATVIFSTHNMESVERLCENIALIDHAKVVLSGNMREIKDKYRNSIFRCHLRSEEINIDPNLGRLIEQERFQDQIHAQIQLLPEQSGNKLIASLLNQGELLQFDEVLPSMNDIFIETVTKKNL